MPTVKLTQTYINSLPIPPAPYWILDAALPALRLYIGKKEKTYFLKYKNAKGKSDLYKIGNERLFTPIQAREAARTLLAQMAVSGTDIKRERRPKENMPTLKNLYDLYQNAGGKKYILDNVRLAFGAWSDINAMEMTPLKIETWRQGEIKTGRLRNASINRRSAALKTLLNWAVAHELLPANPLALLKKLPEVDSDIKIRYLSTDERARLFAAIDAREARLRAERRRTLDGGHRQYLPPLEELPFADYFKPLVILALNTGIRRNALFSLQWEDVDLDHATVHLAAASAKNKKDAYLPLNSAAEEALRLWRSQAPANNPLVFPSPLTGGKMNSCKKVWHSVLKSANIANFRWHDMRHDFASRLVMAGVDLNTVRELMTHSDISMTLRYAHLAPEKKKEAVEKLSEPPG